MDLARISISEYTRFERYLENLRSPDFPYDQFVVKVIHLSREQAVTYLRRATRHPSFELVCEAIDLLARLSPLDAAPRCLDLLDHPEPAVRQVAIESLVVARVPCEDAAIRRLDGEVHGDVRKAWVELLERLGTDFCLPTLRTLAASDQTVDYEGRPTAEFAARAVTRIEERAARSPWWTT